MLVENIIISLILAGILLLSVEHGPVWFKAFVAKLPPALVAIVLHFGYGGWIGGVTGHLVGAFLSVPVYFGLKHWLNEKWTGEASEAWDKLKARKPFKPFKWFSKEPISTV